ncbi:hypothetical protein D9M71_660510 [compost metagenome]
MWHNVLEGPYRRYVDLHGPSPASLENIIALISRIGLAYCLVPAEESEIRAQMRMLRHFQHAPR